MHRCCECNRKFKTTKAAERAANNGCPGCGGVDIDLDTKVPVVVQFPKPSDAKPSETLREVYDRVVKELHLKGRA